jgi:hypothetical protein
MRLTGSVTLAWLAFMQPAQVEASVGAYLVDDADIGKPGSCQTETWLSTASNRDFLWVVAPICVVTIGLPVEFTAVYQRGRAEGEWSTTPVAQAKILPINGDRFALSLSSGMIWDSATQSLSGYVNMPLTFKFGQDFRIHVDVGWLHDRRVNVDYVTGGIGLEWDFLPKFSLQTEVYIQEGRQGPLLRRSIIEPRTQFGLRYVPVDTVDIDFVYGHNIGGASGHWFTLGLTVRME